MQCPYCGNEVRADAKFCDSCGQPLVAASGAGASPVSHPVPPAPTPRVVSTPPPVAAPIEQSQVSGRIRGIVRGFQSRSESQSMGQSHITWTVWTFRLESHDQGSNLVQRVPVEMRGLSMEGSINDGDEVEINGRWQSGQTAQPSEAYNLTTHSTVRTKGVTRGQRACSTVVLVFFIVFILAIVAVAWLGWNSFLQPAIKDICSSWPDPASMPPFCR